MVKNGTFDIENEFSVHHAALSSEKHDAIERAGAIKTRGAAVGLRNTTTDSAGLHPVQTNGERPGLMRTKKRKR